MFFLLQLIISLLLFNQTTSTCNREVKEYYEDNESKRGYVIFCSHLFNINEIKIYSNYEDVILNITESNISTIGSHELSKFPTIKYLNLNKTHINSILPEAFNGLNQLRGLYLSDNNLTEISNGVFKSLNKLQVLNLANNNITQIDKLVFSGLSDLETLVLRQNQLSEIHPMVFRDLANLKFLDLSENSIGEIRFGVFDSLVKLEVLNISSNKFVNLDYHMFNLLSNLRRLYFDNNRISTLNIKYLVEHCPYLQEISLDNNPWGCKELIEIHNYLKKMRRTDMYGRYLIDWINPGRSYDVENFKGIACSGSSSEKLSKLSNTTYSYADNNNIAKTIGETINNSLKNWKIERFFNIDFDKTKFVQYFNKDFTQSKFFKYFENYKFEPMSLTGKGSTGTTAEKLITANYAAQTGGSNDRIFVFSIVLQIVMVALMIFIVYLMYGFVTKNKINVHPELSSQMELC